MSEPILTANNLKRHYEVKGGFMKPNATVRANVNNLTDRKYINSLYQVGYYGAPSNYTLSFNYRF